MENNSTKAWIAIIISIVVAFSGMTFGIVKTVARAEVVRGTEDIKVLNNRVNKLEESYASIDERLFALKEGQMEIKDLLKERIKGK
jgi:hypothetical protein